MSRFATHCREAWASVREYTAGVQSRDLERLFRRDAAEAYQVLTRDLPTVPEEERGPKAVLRRLRVLFLGLSYTLSPPRRVLFALALLLALADTCAFRVSVGNAGRAFAQSYRTANEIGGDYYDYLPLPDGRLVIVAGDASGHGMAAGLLMVVAHTSLRLSADLDPRPEAAVPLLNRALASTGGRRAFLTLFYGLLEPASGRLDYVCAGHPFPLLRRLGGELEELGTGSLPLGIRRELRIEPRSVVLGPGDLLLVHSDGLAEEVHPTTGEAFGFDRLRRLLAPGGGAREVHDRVLGAFDGFLAGESQRDDISLVVVEREATAEPC
ncbi:MAG TPA: PP2C family protein-serine/threonine phosphatase [Thermoanaerobaculia bacterium]|nr:PP2C family protein-serine/threonine phosphatase [Thermoanaerobaculia bacterium]